MEITLNLNAVLAVNQFAMSEKEGKSEKNGITFAPGNGGAVVIGATNRSMCLRAVCQEGKPKDEIFYCFSLNLQGLLKGVKPNKKNPLWISFDVKGDGTVIVEIEGKEPVSLKSDTDFMTAIERSFLLGSMKSTKITEEHNQFFFDERYKKFFLDKFFVGGMPLFTRNGDYGIVTYPKFNKSDYGIDFDGVFVQYEVVETVKLEEL